MASLGATRRIVRRPETSTAQKDNAMSTVLILTSSALGDASVSNQLVQDAVGQGGDVCDEADDRVDLFEVVYLVVPHLYQSFLVRRNVRRFDGVLEVDAEPAT